MRVLVFGTFDGLHPGHRFVLDAAAKRGEMFVVVARDENVEKFKGRLPLQNEQERKEAIASLYPDANVRIGEQSDFLLPVREIQPDLILLGYDQKLPHDISEADFPCKIERLEPFEPEKYKSSKLRPLS